MNASSQVSTYNFRDTYVVLTLETVNLQLRRRWWLLYTDGSKNLPGRQIGFAGRYFNWIVAAAYHFEPYSCSYDVWPCAIITHFPSVTVEPGQALNRCTAIITHAMCIILGAARAANNLSIDHELDSETAGDVPNARAGPTLNTTKSSLPYNQISVTIIRYPGQNQVAIPFPFMMIVACAR